jgi:hypothetical protein
VNGRRSIRAALVKLGALAAIVAGSTPAGGQQSYRCEGAGPLQSVTLPPEDSVGQCMLSEEFTVAGLYLGDPLAVLDRLGTPRGLTSSYGEDDGGGYIAYTYRYDGLAVEIVRDMIDLITAAGPGRATPSGLRVGMARVDVIRVLGNMPGVDYATDTGYSFPACQTPDGRNWSFMYFELNFDTDDRLATIRLVADRP